LIRRFWLISGIVVLVFAPAAAALAQDLSVTKTGPAELQVGDRFSYTITVANNDPLVQAFSVVMTDTLPAGLSFVSVSPSINCTGTTTITCNESFLDVGPANAVTYTITVDLVSGEPGATLTNTASITQVQNVESPPDTVGNNSDVAVAVIAGGDLSLALGFSSPSYQTVGQLIEVQYVVTNPSTATVTGIAVTDPKVPTITCPQTSLVASAAMTCTGPYIITAADIAAGTSAFTATVTGSGGATATATGAVGTVPIQSDDFVRTRGQLLQVDPPSLHDRIGQITAGVTETNGDPTLNFAGSFLGGAGTAANDLASGAVALPLKFWIDSKLTLHTRDNGGGGFGQLGLGGDYLVTENLLVGAALYIDWMTDNKTDRTTTGAGYLTGPYVSTEIAEHLTFDGAIFLGGSTNDVTVSVAGIPFSGTFNTQRVVGQAQIDGLWDLEMLTIRSDATMFLRHETVGDYTVRDALGNVIPVSGFTNTSLNLSGGALFERAMPLENGLIFIPQAGFRLGITGRSDAVGLDNPYGSVSAGFVLEGNAWTYQSTAELALWAPGLKAVTWTGRLAGEF
jgi:uncharacterized repeat protein (TIGR01451 family)